MSLSRIGSFFSPLFPKGDAVERPALKKDGGGNQRSGEETPDDVTFFSLEAICALLEQENVSLDGDVQSSLDLLRRHGVVSVPIRNEQPILEAIAEAAARLRER